MVLNAQVKFIQQTLSSHVKPNTAEKETIFIQRRSIQCTCCVNIYYIILISFEFSMQIQLELLFFTSRLANIYYRRMLFVPSSALRSWLKDLVPWRTFWAVCVQEI